MLVGIAAISKRLYPQAATPSAAFYQLVSERLLPWLLEQDASAVSIGATTELRKVPRSGLTPRSALITP